MANRQFALLLLAFPLLAHAQGTKLWKQSTFENFEKGTPRGVAIYSDGRLEPSSAPVEVLTTPAASIWSAAADAHGNVYLGTGSPAEVLKVAPDGKSTPLLKTKDVSVQAVTVGPDGMIYAATLPNGKVYRLNPNGPAVVLSNAPQRVYASATARTGTEDAGADVVFDPGSVDPKPTYIWDLAFDKAGRLYVATGGPAAIYRVDLRNRTAKPEKFFSSSEQHIRTLLFGRDGTLYAGTDGRGLVYRISPDGKGFVLFEAPKQEIPAMALDPAGNLYVAAMGDKTRTSLPPLSVHSAPTMTATIRIVTGGAAESSTDSTLIPNGTVIFEIAPDGAPRQLWASPHDVVYALAWQPGGSNTPGGLLAGSGNQGHVYRISPDCTFADLAHLEALQTTAFAFAGDTVYAATSNAGKLYRMSGGAAGKGDGSTYVSQVHDAKFFSEWSRAQTRGTGSYDLFARVGNIEQPGEGWSAWQKITPGSSAPAPEKGRFLQWKAVLRRGAILDSVGVYYLPQNVAPVVDEIVVQLHARVTPTTNPEGQTTTVPVNLPSGAADAATYQAQQSGTATLMAVPVRNWATARWSAHDDNGDQLSYSLYYRGDGERNWMLLRKNIHQTWTSFDLTRIPDGGYIFRVVASDAPSQPAGEALTGYRDSSHLLLDTQTPVLSAVRATAENGSIHVMFDAQTKLSTIARAYYSVDAGPWQYVEPVGRLSDSTTEHYDFTAPVAKAGDVAGADTAPGSTGHVIAVRVVDRAGNAATGKAVVP